MNKIKYSALTTLLVIISSAIIVIGMAVGTLCHFTAGGFFNFGGEYAQYNSVSVNYLVIDNDQEEVDAKCQELFKAQGVSYYSVTFADTNQGGEITYKFNKSVDVNKLEGAVSAINTALATDGNKTPADLHKATTLLGGGKTLVMASIAVAACVVFHFVYTAIRFKLAMALSAIIADVHNLGLFVALMAITRIPVGSSLIAFGALTAVATMVATCIIFNKIKKNFTSEEGKKLPIAEKVDTATADSAKSVIALACVMACALVVLEIFSIITAPSLAVVTPLVCGVIATACVLYGTLFFTPAIVAPFKAIAQKKNDKK